LNDLDHLEQWPEKVKKMQKEWIGKTKGAVLEFNIEDKVREYRDQLNMVLILLE
jgi:leucyl-tRNA synthetase